MSRLLGRHNKLKIISCCLALFAAMYSAFSVFHIATRVHRGSHAHSISLVLEAYSNQHHSHFETCRNGLSWRYCISEALFKSGGDNLRNLQAYKLSGDKYDDLPLDGQFLYFSRKRYQAGRTDYYATVFLLHIDGTPVINSVMAGSSNESTPILVVSEKIDVPWNFCADVNYCSKTGLFFETRQGEPFFRVADMSDAYFITFEGRVVYSLVSDSADPVR